MVDDPGRGGVLGVEGVSGDHRISDVETCQEFSECGDLVALGVDGMLPEHDPAVMIQCRDQVSGRCRGGSVTTQGLAIDSLHHRCFCCVAGAFALIGWLHWCTNRKLQ